MMWKLVCVEGAKCGYNLHYDVQIIETGDSVKVKQVLDECMVDSVKESGYNINYGLENLKLFLMFLCCVFAMVAQFSPTPFPENLTLLGVCCGSYFLLSTVVQFIITFVEKDKLIETKPKEGAGEESILIIRTAFAKYQEYYDVTIHGTQGPTPFTKGRMYVGKYFTERGEFDQVGFIMDVKKLLVKFEQKQYKEIEFSFKQQKQD